jgi:hypothetical protein
LRISDFALSIAQLLRLAAFRPLEKNLSSLSRKTLICHTCVIAARKR